MNNATLQAIGRLRRNQGRNPDAMLVCDTLEKLWHQYKSIANATKIEVKNCEECKRRREQVRDRVRKYRGSK